ncbi:MAG TPA: peptidoglycan DD-metalloendopeptidase family protein, partial [Longimicrobiaceae bacterium]
PPHVISLPERISMPTIRPCPRHPALALLPSLAAALLASACGGDGPPTDPGADVTVELSSTTLTLTSYAKAQLDATVRRNGSPIASGVVWSSSDTTIALVTATGEVRGRIPGTATITAKIGSSKAVATVTVAPELNLGEFRAPFDGQWRNSTAFDHDIPRQFQPAFDNGYLLTFWGEKLTSDIDGHNGYDWALPTGTPVLAAGPGTVSFAGSEQPFFCPLLNTTTAGLWVSVAHGVAPHELLFTQYGHFSRIDVVPGQHVVAGQQLGLSGTTGCSTGPHLHFSFFRKRADYRTVVMDPYGWHGGGGDRWASDTAGIASVDAWGAAAPVLFRETRGTAASLATDRPGIAAVRWMGPDDAHNPNNEFVEIVVSAALGVADLGGFSIRSQLGERFTFPAGARVNAGAPVRVYSGAGASSATAYYWGRSTPVWTNGGGCAVLENASGQPLWAAAWGSSNACAGQFDRSTLLSAVASAPLEASSPHAAEMLKPR